GLVHRLPDASRLLDVDDHGLALRMTGRGHALLVDHDRGLMHLAAEADQDVGRHVRVLGIAGEHALEGHVVLAEELGAAAGLVGDRKHAVDVRVIAGHVAELVLDELAHAGRAVDPGDDGHVVARADAPVVSEIAVEVAHARGRVDVDRPDVGADLVLALQIAHGQVLGVDVIAHGDVGGGEADDLPVAPHRLAAAPRMACHLVPGPDVLADLDAPARVLEDGAGRNLLLGDGHVIGGVEHDGHFGDRAGYHECLPGAHDMPQNLQAAPWNCKVEGVWGRLTFPPRGQITPVREGIRLSYDRGAMSPCPLITRRNSREENP